MGGVFYRKSEIITPTEFNAFCDPEALKIVLDSGVPILMVGLDVTMQVLIEAPQYAELATITLETIMIETKRPSDRLRKCIIIP